MWCGRGWSAHPCRRTDAASRSLSPPERIDALRTKGRIVEGVGAIAELPRLKSLRLGSQELCPDGEGGAELGAILLRFPALKSLHLIDVPLGDEGLDALARYDGLWNLYLDGAGVSDAAWERYFALHPEVHVHVDQAHHDRDPHKHDHP